MILLLKKLQGLTITLRVKFQHWTSHTLSSHLLLWSPAPLASTLTLCTPRALLPHNFCTKFPVLRAGSSQRAAYFVSLLSTYIYIYIYIYTRDISTLEWVAYPFSRGSSNPGIELGSLLHRRQILYLLSYQGIFPTQESNLGLLHHRQMLYRLSHQGSPVSAHLYPITFIPAKNYFPINIP